MDSLFYLFCFQSVTKLQIYLGKYILKEDVWFRLDISLTEVLKEWTLDRYNYLPHVSLQ